MASFNTNGQALLLAVRMLHFFELSRSSVLLISFIPASVVCEFVSSLNGGIARHRGGLLCIFMIFAVTGKQSGSLSHFSDYVNTEGTVFHALFTGNALIGMMY